MLEIGSTFLSFMIGYIADCILFKKVVGISKKILNLKNVISIIFFSIISCFIDMNYSSLPRFVFADILICLLYKLIFDKSMTKSILFAIAVIVVSNMAEFIFALVFIVGLKMDAMIFTDGLLGNVFGNLFITILYSCLLLIKPIKWIVQRSINFFNESAKTETVILLILTMFLLTGLTYPIIVVSSLREKITYSLIFIAFVYFIGNFFYQRSKNGELKKSYDYLLDYVKEYEKALEEKSKAQHEYKNQLSVIRGMANKDNKKLHKYIDDMLEVEENKEAHILNSLKPLPTGGLKGLIYYKTASMLKKNMEVHVNVDSALENGKYWDLCEKNLHNISTIVGVYLDNAIEAAEKAEKKFVIIDIDADEGNIIFSFSNTYEGHIEVGKMDKQGYSTKGKSRGYGLSLVQDILNKSTYLKQEREMNGIFYVQKLIIQNKK